MFRLADSTRRKIAFGLFFTLCVLPTAVVLVLVAWQERPGHVQAEADRLGRLLGRKVTLEDVVHPKPYVTVYHGLRVSSAESDKPLLQLERLESAFKVIEDEQGRRHQRLMLNISGAHADADELGQFRGFVDRLLSGGTAWSGLDVGMAVSGRLELSSGDNPASGASGPTLTDVCGHVTHYNESVWAEIQFRQADLQMPDPVGILIQRRKTDPPETHLWLDTRNSFLPTSTLALGLAQFGHLGPACRFHGVLESLRTIDGSSGGLVGEFQEVNLDTVVSDQFVHQLGGLADLNLELAQFSQGRLTRASGTLESGPGLVSQSFLDAAQNSLGLPRGYPSSFQEGLIRYDRLAVWFALDSATLRLQGHCPTDLGDAIMTNSTGPLLGPSAVPSHPIAALIRALYPHDSVGVPATRQADRLMSRLPLPEGRRPVYR